MSKKRLPGHRQACLAKTGISLACKQELTNQQMIQEKHFEKL
jgi:hypothetical protein